ncbi:pilus assembly protein PilM [Patescibacteria group bacterium]|nr:MAG: pilus assembly protein PilM [Patescibacteria group bacterium]
MAKLFFKDKPIIGLDIGTTSIKVMAVDAKKWLVLGYGSIDLDPTQAKQALEGDGQYLIDQLQKLLSEKILGTLPSNHVVIGIPASRTYSRTFTLPTSLEKSLRDAVQTEADQYIPIPSGTLYIDHEIIERNKKSLTVLMSAVSQNTVDGILRVVESVDLRPVLIEPSISAVARVLTATEEGHLPTIVVDIGPAGTDIAVLDSGYVRVTGGIAVGGNTLTLAIAKKLSVTLENAHQLKVINGLNAGPRQQKIISALNPSLERIATEIEKIIRYYNERINDDRKLEQLLIVGSGSNVPGIGEFFTNRLVMPARTASPWQRLDFGKLPEPAKQLRPHYITVAGLASITPEEVRK